jgi:hypothetical protein
MNKIKQVAAEKLKRTLKTDKKDDEVVEFFMDYFIDQGLMPYQAARAHTADPYEWTNKKLSKMKTPELETIIDALTESVDAGMSISQRFELRMK